MKPRAPKLLGASLTCLAVVLLLAEWPAHAVDSPVPSPLPTASASPGGSPKRGTKHNGSPDATPKPPKIKQPKDIAFPLPIGDSGKDIKIPQLGVAGEIIQQLLAVKMTHIDNEHVEMHEAKIDLYHPDGKEDFHVVLPDSVLNLKTQIITSDHPVTVRTADFELTGERMEFNTVDRTGELQGHVHMVIRNFKQVANLTPAAPAP